jgi:hypothetical protein
MAKCLRCGAGPEWIQGRVPDEKGIGAHTPVEGGAAASGPDQPCSPNGPSLRPATLEREEREHDQTLKERDHAEAMADKLAAALATLLGVEIGEHSSGNCPWTEALEAFEERPQPQPDVYYCTPEGIKRASDHERAAHQPDVCRHGVRAPHECKACADEPSDAEVRSWAERDTATPQPNAAPVLRQALVEIMQTIVDCKLPPYPGQWETIRAAAAKLLATADQQSGDWCSKCGCGNDKAGFAHLPTCNADPKSVARACPTCGEWREDGSDCGVSDKPAAEQQQPTMKCPKCPAEYPDFDGFGVLHCTACGYCKHPSITDGVCGLCGQSPKAPPCPCCFGTGQELVIRDKTYTRASCSKCNGTGQQA